MSKTISNAVEIINGLGGDPRTGECRCPVPGHGQGRGDRKPSLWISPEGRGLKCHAGCTYKSVIAAIEARGITVRYAGGTTSGLPPLNVDIDEAQRFLDLLDPKAKSWTFQTFDDSGQNRTPPTILHGTLAEHAAQLKRQSRYGAGVFVAVNETDGKGRKRENIVGVRAVSVDLDGSPLAPVQDCELQPHVVVETSPGRFQAHWRVKDMSLDEFEAIMRGIAKRFHGDAQIAELAHCARLPGFEHAKDPAKRFQVRIVEATERAPYTAAEIRKAFPPAAKSATPKPKPKPINSPTLKARREQDVLKADKYFHPDGTPKTREEIISDAAKLDRLDYDPARKELMETLGLRSSTLDEVVAERREEEKVSSFIELDEPWPDPVDGAELLDELRRTFSRHVFMTRQAAIACSLWTVFGHAHDAFWRSPILGITSPTLRCGKTTLLEVLQGVTTKALPASNVTPAVVFRVVDKCSPTLLIDEADTFLGKDDLRGILNSGYNRNQYILRCEGESLEPKKFKTWAPKAIARIGKLPATLADRAIPISLSRKPKDANTRRAPKDPKAAFEELRRKCARWALDHFAELEKAKPTVPEALNDRAKDSWSPLIAIAAACSKSWADDAREAALKLSGDVGTDAELHGVLLLGDIKELFDEFDADEMPSSEIVEELVKREDRPWPELYKGKPLTARGVARLLEPFGIRPKQLTETQRQGYRRKMFARAWERYLSSGTLEIAEIGQKSVNLSSGSSIFFPEDRNSSSGIKSKNPEDKSTRKGLRISQIQTSRGKKQPSGRNGR